MRCFLSLIVLLHLSFPLPGADKITLLADKDLKEPFGGDFDKAGNYVLAEFGGHALKSVGPDGKVATIAGNGSKGYKDGPALEAQFNSPHNCVVHPRTGDIYIADTFNHCVRKWDAKTMMVSTVLGTGKPGFGGDGGPAAKATCNEAYHVAFDPTAKLLYLADIKNFRIRRIDLDTGIVTTVVGNGKKGIPSNGTVAADAPLVDPRAVAVDAKGRLFILERHGHALRMVADGKIETLAGTGKSGHAGDGGPALQATFNGPKFLWIEPNNDVLIADTENHAVRRYDFAHKTMQAVAGTGMKGKGGIPGAADHTALQRPHGVAICPDGSLLISDTENNRVLIIRK